MTKVLMEMECFKKTQATMILKCKTLGYIMMFNLFSLLLLLTLIHL